MAEGQDILDTVVGKLEGARKQGGYWMARCPAHDDGEASLQVALGTEQPVVLVCMAGCVTDDVLAAIGMTTRDISAGRDDRPAGTEWTPHGDATAVYDYTDETGTLLYQVLRVPGKHFPLRVPDPASKTGWRWRLGGTRRVLYRLAKVRAAINAGSPVWIAEGEKDVQSLERHGVVATCNPGGAGNWRPEYALVFEDAIVTIVADADAPGRKHARQIAETLEGVAAGYEIREPAEGKDVTDHLEAGLALADLVTTRETATAAPVLALDLHVFIGGEDRAEDWVIKDLLERGDRLIWTGQEGLGKTMVTRQIAVAAAAGIHPFGCYSIPPQRVLFIDCENAVRKSRRHFKMLEYVSRNYQRRVPDGGFMIVHRPAGIDLTREDEQAFVMERVTAYRPDLLVIGPLYKLHAVDANEELSARAIVTALDMARMICDSALIVEAHSPHGEVTTTLRPAGSSLFLRWPEFGYGIKRKDKNSKRLVEVKAWRGPRDERSWPEQLEWGQAWNEWPWVVPGTVPLPQRAPGAARLASVNGTEHAVAGGVLL